MFVPNCAEYAESGGVSWTTPMPFSNEISGVEPRVIRLRRPVDDREGNHDSLELRVDLFDAVVARRVVVPDLYRAQGTLGGVTT
jgi:hypothetical protein